MYAHSVGGGGGGYGSLWVFFFLTWRSPAKDHCTKAASTWAECVYGDLKFNKELQHICRANQGCSMDFYVLPLHSNIKRLSPQRTLRFKAK